MEPASGIDASDFARSVIAWQRREGRHHLPWQNTADAYLIWLSEIMLQQTQVGAVVPYFQRFVGRFPTLPDLARATEDEVLAVWSGLGYYARARNLHRAAQYIVEQHGGRFPDQFDDIVALPGVGRSTAGAIAVFAFGQRWPIMDGNVKRVVTRCFGVEGYPGERAVADRLWSLVQLLLPHRDVETYTQGLMDLGAQVCMRSHPRCSHCPVAQRCVARSDDRTDQLPTPKPRKARPQRTTVMLIMVSDGKIMMEKRPSPGIWGGLWSFPETDDVESAVQVCRIKYGIETQAVERMAPIEHGFTHFSLTIAPLLCRVPKRQLQAEMPGRVWVGADEAMAFAIPAPVRKLMSQLRGPLGQPLPSPAQAG